MMKRIMLIGDSITQQSYSTEFEGWGASLSNWYIRKADVINRGFSGYNSTWINRMMPGILPIKDGTHDNKEDLILATVFLGANDSVHELAGQHVDLKTYRDNINGIINHINRYNKDTVIILITPPIVDKTQWPTRNIERVTQYAQVIRDIGVERSISVVDLHDTADGHTHIVLDDLRDGLHLGKTGNVKLFNHLQHIITTKYHTIRPDDIEGAEKSCMLSYFPHFSELTDISSEEAFLLLDKAVAVGEVKVNHCNLC